MKFAAYLNIMLLWLCGAAAFGQSLQEPKVSGQALLHATKDSVYVDMLNELCNEYALSGKKDAMPYARQALQLADSLGYLRGQGIANLNLAIIYDTRGNYHQALEYYLRSMKQLRKVKDELHLSQLLQSLGYFYHTQGNYPKAIAVTKQAADLTFKNGGELGSVYCWNNLGYYYAQAGDYDSALYFTLKAYEVMKIDQDTAGLADVFYNLGTISWKADRNAQKGLSYCLQALEYYQAPPFEAEPYVECKAFTGFLYLQQQNYSLAEQYLQESLQEAKKYQHRFIMKNIYRWQADLYAEMKLWNKAYENHQFFFQLHDSIYNEHSANRVEQLKAAYELETREAKIELLHKSKSMQQHELERQMLYRNSFMVLFALFLIVAAVLYKSNTHAHKTNKALKEQKLQIEAQNAAIIAQNKQLEEQQQVLLYQAQHLNQANQQISLQRKDIDQKTHDLTSSLNYARRIQTAMMPQPEELKEALPDSFIWLSPKETISGDFYWFARQHHKLYLVAVDCTGHGVPGALLSLIGDVYLNQTILQEALQEADHILNRLHEHVRRTLNQESNLAQDGMEVGLCIIDTLKREVQFAGARNNLYLCQGGEVQKIYGDRAYIGGYTSPDFPGFKAHTFSITQPTAFYLSTDGIRNQFGGEQDKKWGEKRLMELLAAHWQLPMEQQKEVLCEELQNWMQGYEQTDDMMMIGWKA